MVILRCHLELSRAELDRKNDVGCRWKMDLRDFDFTNIIFRGFKLSALNDIIKDEDFRDFTVIPNAILYREKNNYIIEKCDNAKTTHALMHSSRHSDESLILEDYYEVENTHPSMLHRFLYKDLDVCLECFDINDDTKITSVSKTTAIGSDFTMYSYYYINKDGINRGTSKNSISEKYKEHLKRKAM